MKLIGIITPTEKQEIVVEADTYSEAEAEIRARIPDGWQLLNIRKG